MTRIGFIGLGNMGGPMAANLARAGHAVRVFDLMPESVAKAIAAGCIAAGDAREAVTGCDLAISMLPAGEHVRGLWLAEGGGQDLLGALPAGAQVIDCSTIDVASARAVGDAAKARGIRFLDAPVSGGVTGAAAGTLTFIVGGESADFEAARPILACMGQNLFHAGALGAGQIAKMCNNMLLAIHMAGTAEALALGVKEGLDPGVLSTIMGKSSGNNWSLERYNPWPGVMENAPASRGYEGGFMTRLMVKDLGLAMALAEHAHSAVPMGALARNLFNLHASQSRESKDFSSILELYLDKSQDKSGAM
ncbi:3-hydroxyisobutyrate dehydrogenase [Aeromonas media]|uniref:3-hydroxyisobutyrate dehydrogenase n=1 Tax=Aeromonas media TaxID=651 RepID=A0AAW5RQ20_AERME|nr:MULTISPECIES: 3-hydroxyisobutyrate dehydrogenase [Aeromonas]MCV3289298.1 3-hydroxyisobutyrate dehydrogenase [Aeromonas media]UCP13224.1 3-hydroxyisobutyrate dehydrogenase [Aeromonas media]WED79652.1 3-hydroxyisobutyrate dehydrogenase [Aeromonas media]